MFVATQDPNSLIRIDMTSLLVSWTVPLSVPPDAVAAMASTVIVGGGSTLWSVDGKKATKFATAKQSVLAMTASDEGAFVHVAEAAGIEVFDAAGKLQKTLDLQGQQAPVAMAAVPSGSSLFLGQGNPSGTATPNPNGEPGAISTVKPPTTSMSVVDTARDIVSYPPVQEAVLVAVAILFLCWLFIRWYDKRTMRQG